MSITGQILRVHQRIYEATDGRIGHGTIGVPTLLLRTRGRRSGATRTNALAYARDGDAYLVVASKGGAPQHPAWYLNLDANPDVEIQVKGDKMRAHARTATPDEKAKLWPIMTSEWPDYDRYQEQTDRDIPVVVLQPGRATETDSYYLEP